MADRPHKWTIFFSLIAVCISLFSGWYARQQYTLNLQVYSDNKEAGRVQREAMQEFVDATKKLANSTIETAKIARENLEEYRLSTLGARRAWFELTGMQVQSTPLTHDTPLRLYAGLLNRGGLPATDLEARQWVSISSTFQPNYSSATPVIHAGTVGRVFHLEISQPQGIKLSKEEVADILAGRRKLFVYGRATYRDMNLKPEQNHTITWCGVYVIGSPDLDTGEESCGPFNRSD